MAITSRKIRLTDLDQLPPPEDHTMFTIQGGAAAKLPIKQNPIRFAILYRNGCTSNAWGVQVRPAGDAYVYCRDNMQAQHVSLHASGKQHITIDPNSPSAGDLSEKQFMNQWHEPDEGIATFRVLQCDFYAKCVDNYSCCLFSCRVLMVKGQRQGEYFVPFECDAPPSGPWDFCNKAADV